MAPKIGIIGGSGLYKIGLIKNIKEHTINTPYGTPSDTISVGYIENVEVAFLPRHGKKHTIAPHKINYRANIFALKKLGIQYLISTNAVGSLRKEMRPCDFVIAHQLIDKTAQRTSTFFEDGIVAHVGFADPFCNTLSDLAYQTIKEQNIRVHTGTYVCMEGPQFSTRAESHMHRSWNADVVGMTLATEAKLAREAEMCLCGILTVTDYDCWHEEEEAVSVSSVVENLKKNDDNLATIINSFIPKIPRDKSCACHHALNHAIISSSENMKQQPKEVQEVLLKKYL